MFLYNSQGSIVETFAEMMIDPACKTDDCYDNACADKGMFYTGKNNVYQGSNTAYCADMKMLPYHTIGSGNDLMTVKKTPYECKKMCALNPDCAAVTWKTEEECFLKTKAVRYKYDPAYTTVVKFT